MLYCMEVPDTLTVAGVQAGMWIAVSVLLLVVLYHVLFIVVDVRKIVRRFNRLTEDVESVLEKPLAMTDRLLRWGIAAIEEKTEKHQHKKHH
ncbi:MAG: hypothetical protein G01um101425_809 [Candidatus Peregrinibacteria bacterium Gr01-1014_25]|nr:MAG: hypothetical protein G01um101425_809 [Candidatus Peregrinibacteria bacterium Gr01-1014_25]